MDKPEEESGAETSEENRTSEENKKRPSDVSVLL